MLKEDFRRPRRNLLVSTWLDSALLLIAMQISSGTVTLTKSPTLPEKKYRATISCSSTLPEPISIYLNGSSLTVCNNGICLPTQKQDGSHVYSVNNREAQVTIASLDRDRDQGKWKCSSGVADSIEILVYTFPSNLTLTYGGNTEVDLARSSVTLQCQTDTCTYPAPSVKWYYSFSQGNKTRLYNETSTTMKGVGGNCSFPENILASSLILPIYTTWPDNSIKTVNFFCGIEYLDSSRNINSSASKGITFAEVELEHCSRSLGKASSLNVTSGETVTLRCVLGISRPVPTIDWYIGEENKSSGISNTFTFIPRSVDHDKVIFCRAYNVDPKRTVNSGECRLYVRDEPVLHVQSNKTVSIGCVPGESRPDPIIEWYVGSDMKNSTTFTPSNQDHNKPIYCRAYNLHPARAAESYKSRLNVEDYPIIIYNVSSPLTVNETQSVSVICEAKGNPIPNVVRWRGRQESNVLLFDNLKRQDTGTYTCEATSQSKKYGTLTSQKQLDIIVQYAPAIKVTVSGTTMQNQTVVLVCEARGVPAKNTFNPWTHMWKNDVIRTGLKGTTNSTHTTLLIERLSLENIGKYICFASNGIRGDKEISEQRGSVSLNVTGVPTILRRDSIFTGEKDRYVNISIPLYSNPAIERFYFLKNGTPLANTSDINTYLLHEDTNLKMYGKSVQLEAQTACIVLQNLAPSDFDNYTLVLRNPIGETEFTFQLNSYSPPFRVETFNFIRFVDEQIELHFLPGFNGGPEQTFVIEYSSCTGPDNVWKNTSVTDLKEKGFSFKLPNGTFSVNVTKLPPGDYLYRMYSWNVRGNSPYSGSIRVIIPSPIVKQVLQDANEQATIAGGSIAALFVIALIAGVVIFQKRKSDRSKLSDDEIQDGLVINVRHTSHSRLEGIGKTNIISLDFRRYSAVVYENLPEKNVIANQNDVYENALENVPIGADVYVADESVYENQFGVNSHLMIHNGCLIYADLELESPKTSEGKQIIHGLENRTEYAEIAFGLRGEPLTDSDDE